MSKKLLEESTVRSFMKLANIGTLSDKFIQESWGEQEEPLNEEEEGEEGAQKKPKFTLQWHSNSNIT